MAGKGNVNAVGPTFVRPGNRRTSDDPEFLSNVLARFQGRVATIEMCSAVLYLASDHADMVTGSLLLVDGGWTAV